MDHNFEKQKQETVWVWKDIKKRNPSLPPVIDLDIQFLPHSREANKLLFKEALENAGFVVIFYDEDETVEAKVAEVNASAAAIWDQEERATQIAISFGFKPDGWGFLSTPR
ncbi:MAG: ribonuclease E inhibitor RraB [Pseudomonadota bacterium]